MTINQVFQHSQPCEGTPPNGALSHENNQIQIQALYGCLHYVTKGMGREDACRKVLDLEQQRNDPSNQILTGDNSDPIIYNNSALNEPNIQITPQILAIAKELEYFFDYEITEVDDFDLK